MEFFTINNHQYQFDLSNFDDFELKTYQSHIARGIDKNAAIIIMVNDLDGDLSQASESFGQFAEMLWFEYHQ
jgi:hypothetical protein